jgi:hypothetical protein
MTRRNEHTGWCARGHLCGLGEHRSDPIVVHIPGLARAVLTRVRSVDGDEHAEIRVRLALHPAEPVARRQLSGLLSGLRHLLGKTAVTLPTHRPSTVEGDLR